MSARGDYLADVIASDLRTGARHYAVQDQDEVLQTLDAWRMADDWPRVVLALLDRIDDLDAERAALLERVHRLAIR